MKNEDFWDLDGYGVRKSTFDADDLDDTDFSAIDEEIKSAFNLNREIIKMLADVRRELMYLARNLETEDDIKRTRDALIDLQDEVDNVVSAYTLSCVDDYIFG